MHIWDVKKNKVYILNDVPSKDNAVNFTTRTLDKYFPCNPEDDNGDGEGGRSENDTVSGGSKTKWILGGLTLFAITGLAGFFVVKQKKNSNGTAKRSSTTGGTTLGGALKGVKSMAIARGKSTLATNQSSLASNFNTSVSTRSQTNYEKGPKGAKSTLMANQSSIASAVSANVSTRSVTNLPKVAKGAKSSVGVTGSKLSTTKKPPASKQ